MKSIPLVVFSLIEGLLISTQWVAMARIARVTPSVFGALGLQHILAALTFLVLHYAINRELPRLSSRSLQAAITLASCCYIFPGILTYWSLTRLPSLVAAMVFSSVPLWLWVWGVGGRKLRPLYLALSIAGAALVMLRAPGHEFTLEQRAWAFVMLNGAAFIFSLGIGLAKKHFWIHSAPELNFWALAFSGGVFLIWAYVFMGLKTRAEVPPRYPWLIFYLGVVATGLAGYLYRYTSYNMTKRTIVLMTLSVPLSAILWSKWFIPGEITLDGVTLAGIGLTIICLFQAARTEAFNYWMTFFVSNSMRRGDRVLCDLEGFIRREKGAMGRLKVVDMSMGGIGFRSDTSYAVADPVVISFPMGNNWTQIALECRVAHYQKVDDSDFPWIGGAEFKKLDPEVAQNLVEFLARMSRLHRTSATG